MRTSRPSGPTWYGIISNSSAALASFPHLFVCFRASKPSAELVATRDRLGDALEPPVTVPRALLHQTRGVEERGEFLFDLLLAEGPAGTLLDEGNAAPEHSAGRVDSSDLGQLSTNVSLHATASKHMAGGL
eukprot:767701-Hanusia_phi.AAC.2